MKLRDRISKAFTALRGYDAAGTTQRWPMAARMPSPTTEALNARGTVGQRAAYLRANSPHIAAAVNSWVTNLIGDGPTLQHNNPEIVKAWNKFWSNCDWEEISDLGGFLQRVADSWAVYGEAFVLLRSDPDDGALRLHLIPVEQIDVSKNADLGNGRVIVQGIELDQGRRTAYWILPTPPDSPFPGTPESSPVSASDVIHVFIPPWPGAVRGISLLAPVLTRAVETDKLEDALLATANVAALLSIYITDPSGGISLGEPINGNRAEVSAEPGTVRIVPADSTVTTVNPPQFNQSVDATRHMVRSIAAGCGLPYELVSHDLSQVNYSSARLGLMEFRRRVVALQKTLIIGQFLNRVFKRFVALEILARRVREEVGALADPVFLFPGWQAIDPQKEADADINLISAGLKSRREAIANRGRDPEEVFLEIAADKTPPPASRPQPLKVVSNE